MSSALVYSRNTQTQYTRPLYIHAKFGNVNFIPSQHLNGSWTVAVSEANFRVCSYGIERCRDPITLSVNSSSFCFWKGFFEWEEIKLYFGFDLRCQHGMPILLTLLCWYEKEFLISGLIPCIDSIIVLGHSSLWQSLWFLRILLSRDNLHAKLSNKYLTISYHLKKYAIKIETIIQCTYLLQCTYLSSYSISFVLKFWIIHVFYTYQQISMYFFFKLLKTNLLENKSTYLQQQY